MRGVLGSSVATLVLASVFVVGRRLGVLDRAYRGRRRVLSAAAGASVAYVFVQVLPELSDYQARFLACNAELALPFPEYRVYIAALVGFVLFYGLENIVFASRLETHSGDFGHRSERLVYRLHIGGFAAYCGLISYLMVDWTHRMTALVLYCAAMAFHFLVIDHALRSEHGERYDAHGRWWLAAGVGTGWALALLPSVPDAALATLQGFVAGGVTINSVKDEMPKASEGRFAWFTAGAFAFAVAMIVSSR